MTREVLRATVVGVAVLFAACDYVDFKSESGRIGFLAPELQPTTPMI